jgi:tRNA-splicing ligase RtcB
MGNRYKHNKKNVHDLKVENSFVRIWNHDGSTDRKLIKKAFQPLLKTSFVYPYVALMPDFHPGEGSMIGSVIPTKDVLLPTVIGNDIGCGISAIRLPIISDVITPLLHELRLSIQKVIPTGSTYNTIVTERVQNNHILCKKDAVPFISERNWKKITRQFGSLGGGNHFLEVQTDEEGHVWIMLHSGSRYLGVLVREYFVNEGKYHPNIDKHLYLKIPYLIKTSDTAKDYLKAVEFAVDFAKESRKEMMLRALSIFSTLIPTIKKSQIESLVENTIDVSHNYISVENYFGKELFIHRKGAIRTRRKEHGIIPGSMGSNSYIVEGKGNEMSFCTCSHGAGRAMSRGDAFRKISEKAFRQSMSDIIYDNTLDLRDEAPQAYKDINTVMRGQKDIVKILYKLKPLMSIKGN